MSSNNIYIARELISIAGDLTARAPQMDKGKPVWRDIRKGQIFKYKGKEWKKTSQTKAVQVSKVMIVRNNELV